MTNRLKRILALLRESLVTALTIAFVYATLSVGRALVGFWPTSITAVALIIACLWVVAGEDSHD